ncbi:MAG: exodeoxyribonuclease VII large subunit [Thiohalocapsa sp.]|nr:exodeoxyribonuclease VII large subunit [Thiohalocapsa sp.]
MSFAAGPQASLDFSRDIWTVSRLNAEVRAVLDASFPLLWIQGEISNLAKPASGHLYFSLKDDASQVRCALFKQKRRLLAFEPGNGQQVLARARVGLYEPRGDFQLIVEQMEPAGEGALRLELERRKRRLAAEGLFDQARKRALPVFPKQIGLITSSSGAAVHDLLTVLGRRLPLLPVIIYPVLVQGEAAASQLIEALQLANRRNECDLLILARGGGSLEDLMAFNDEGLARAIRASAIPVLTGIGHEVDLSIADLAADVRAATPSAAAELAVPSAEQLAGRLGDLERRLSGALRRRLHAAAGRVETAVRRLRSLHPASRLQQRAQQLDQVEYRMRSLVLRRIERERARLRSNDLGLRAASPRHLIEAASHALAVFRQRLARAGAQAVALRRDRLAAIAGRLDALSPLSTLARGYAVVTLVRDGAPLTDAAAAPAGTLIAVRPYKGRLIARVEDGPDDDADPPGRRAS